jgi:pimeloyl-ACP methyl ester carboxylesterase
VAGTPESKLDDIPIGIIEFDDQGVLQNRKYKDEIIDRIRQLTNEHGALTVVFAHGWLNNASPENENLAHFQKMLLEIAATDRAICEDAKTCEGRKVVGVYLAWRGMSATVQPFKALSFWNRKSRAERIGQDGATEVLADLAKVRSAKNETKHSVENRLILIGHSFGGALLYSATQQLLMQDAASEVKGGSVDRTIASLVILVNPAFEAARFTSLHDRADTMTFPKTQSTILAIFTSETDDATKWTFPAGRFLSTLFTKYNPNFPEQPELDRTAIGHYADYQTHELRLGGKQEFESVPHAVCEWERFRKSETDGWDLKRVTLKRNDRLKKLGPTQQMNPYYNVVVDDAIISGHSGIWDPKFFMEFIPRFVAVQKREYRTVEGQPVPVVECPSD